MEENLPSSNPRVRITGLEVLSENWYTLRKATFEYLGRDGNWTVQHREAYDRGNGAVVLLLDPDRRTIILTRQFRMPAYLNRHPDGMLIEAPAGLLDDDDASTAVRRELQEETGYTVEHLVELFDVFMSPGSVTERVVFFAGVYRPTDRTGRGGGEQSEGEDIEIIEIDLDDAYRMIGTGEIRDAKTIMLIQWALLEGATALKSPPS
jgi:nudix-type nucleoside diphosphatase (YffH/AdpP family)